MLQFIFAFALFAGCLAYAATNLELPGPDGGIVMRLSSDSEAHLVFSVYGNGRLRLEPARFGVIVDGKDLGEKAVIGTPTLRRYAGVFPWRGNKTTGTNLCEASEIPIRSANSREWVVETRVFNDGAAFRFRIPGTGTRHLAGETTTWQLPKEATLWFQTDTANYEGEYHSAKADAVPLETEVRQKKRPTHIGLPMTIAFTDGTFGVITEAALYKYSGLTLRPESGAKFRAAFEDDPSGWSHDGAVVSPWRVIVLAKDLNGIVNSDVIAALCEPPDPKLFPDGIITSWIKPGKAPCTWMVFGNDGAQWDRQKWFVDLSAATGCEYLLVDAGWRSEKWGWMKDGGDVWQRAAELCRYAAERNVGVVLWHAYPEGRDDGPGLTKVEAREELFWNCQKAGVKGIKIDFFDSESKAVIEAYEDLLRRSAKYHLMINFHGANKPTGEVRTWPHEITREGIREQEYVLWGTLPLAHYGALPFTRMAVGHADFLPGYIQPKFLKNTTTIFQMASVIVFSSPFLCWPDNPEAYLNSPLLQFVRTVPVTWDETRVLPGSAIGDAVILARRKGTDWYVAVLNCRSEPRSVTLDFSALALEGKELSIYRDAAAGTGCKIETGLKLPRDGKLSVLLRSGGGFIGHLQSPQTFTGWK